MNPRPERETVIETDAVLRGRILGQDDVRVLGTLIGTVSVEALVTIGSSGIVEGDVEAEEIVVLGTVRGELRARKRIVLEESARILGDLSTAQLVLSEGAAVRGRVRTDGGPVRHLAGLDEPEDAFDSDVPLVAARPEDHLGESSAPPARETAQRPRRPRMRVKVRRRPLGPEVS